jgi:hypothetical protein
VNKYVQRAATNPIARHLEFPALTFDEPAGAKQPPVQPAMPAASMTPPAQDLTPGSTWNMESFDDLPKIEIPTSPGGEVPPQMIDFGGGSEPTHQEPDPSGFMTADKPSGNKPPAPGLSPTAASNQANWNAGDSEWVRKDLGKFRVPVPEEGVEENTVSFQYPDGNVDLGFLLKPGDVKPEAGGHGAPAHGTPDSHEPAPAPAPQSHAPAQAPAPAPAVAEKPAQTHPKPGMSQQHTSPVAPALTMTPELQKIIEAEARALLEKVIWKLVPDMATTMIKDEIQRLLTESEKS